MSKLWQDIWQDNWQNLRQVIIKYGLIGLCTFLWVSGLVSCPISVQAQSLLDNNSDSAPVTLDGKVLFDVGKSGPFSAAERAEQIHIALQAEVRSPVEPQLEIVKDNPPIAIRNRISKNHLVTVTEADVVNAADVYQRAVLWQEILQEHLAQAKRERQPAYVRMTLLVCGAVVIGAIALHGLLWRLKPYGFKFLLTKIPDPAWRNSIKIGWQLTFISLQIILWLVVLKHVTDALPTARTVRYQLINTVTSDIFNLGTSSYSALDLIVLLILTVSIWFLVRAFVRMFRNLVLSRTGAERGLQEVVAILMQYILTFLGLIVLWQLWGLDVGSLALIASVLGVGIGFGLQNITNNLISGIIMTLERPIQVGDLVRVGDWTGTIKRIGARSTMLQTLDQVSIIVPNSRFLENEVINWHHDDPTSRLRIPIGVAYGSNIKRVRAALMSAARTQPDVLITPRPQVWFLDFGDSSLNFELMVWLSDPRKQFKIRSDLNYLIAESFERFGVEVPFPQRDLHVRSPQLDQLIQVLLRQQGIQPESTDGINESKPALPQEQSKPEESDSVVQMMSQLDWEDDLYLSLEERLSPREIEETVTAMRQPDGIEIRDRRYRFNVYPTCFIGAEAVTWLVQHHDCSREEATELGQIMLERGLLHHVAEEQPFKDGYFFYRFQADEIHF